MESNEVAIKNAVATAEGAIAHAIERSPVNLHKSACLVMGYGRCAQVLAHKLRGLDAAVAVCARSPDQRALADAFGYEAIPLTDLPEAARRFDFIFNTVPAPVLTEAALLALKSGAFIVDIASIPAERILSCASGWACTPITAWPAGQNAPQTLRRFSTKSCCGASQTTQAQQRSVFYETGPKANRDSNHRSFCTFDIIKKEIQKIWMKIRRRFDILLSFAADRHPLCKGRGLCRRDAEHDRPRAHSHYRGRRAHRPKESL
jgi:hypothetical protein